MNCGFGGNNCIWIIMINKKPLFKGAFVVFNY